MEISMESCVSLEGLEKELEEGPAEEGLKENKKETNFVVCGIRDEKGILACVFDKAQGRPLFFLNYEEMFSFLRNKRKTEISLDLSVLEEKQMLNFKLESIKNDETFLEVLSTQNGF